MGECLSAENIILLAAAATIRLAQGQNAEQLELLGAFFNIIGDNLILLALCAPSCEEQKDSACGE